jgi:hypothetical protein
MVLMYTTRAVEEGSQLLLSYSRSKHIGLYYTSLMLYACFPVTANELDDLYVRLVDGVIEAADNAVVTSLTAQQLSSRLPQGVRKVAGSMEACCSASTVPAIVNYQPTLKEFLAHPSIYVYQVGNTDLFYSPVARAAFTAGGHLVKLDGILGGADLVLKGLCIWPPGAVARECTVADAMGM